MKRGCLDMQWPGQQTDVYLAPDCRKLMPMSAPAWKLALHLIEYSVDAATRIFTRSIWRGRLRDIDTLRIA